MVSISGVYDPFISDSNSVCAFRLNSGLESLNTCHFELGSASPLDAAFQNPFPLQNWRMPCYIDCKGCDSICVL